MISSGHYLFRALQDGKYFAARRGEVEFDYWDELPAPRKAQYEHAAKIMMDLGVLSAPKQFDPEAATLPPPPPTKK
jgi:hypothetical protein